MLFVIKMKNIHLHLIETTPEWCIDNTSEYTEYATINIIFNTIKTPYSYTLYNEFNEELISENGLISKELKFGL